MRSNNNVPNVPNVRLWLAIIHALSLNHLINDRLSVFQTLLSLSTCHIGCCHTHVYSTAKIL